MRASLLLARAVILSVLATSACRRAAVPPPPPRAPQTAGTLQVRGLHAPVSVLRDAAGIPHISASNTDDLFFAQGFTQAQDRLFQMDLWRRASQGRLAEVLGSNFIERDAMTRRIRFRGNLDEEWAAYGPDTHRIATAFVAGINAWVRTARADLPEEFVLAGWAPELWKPEDLLTRTDAFLAGGNALDELFRARLTAAIGAARTDALLPLPGGVRTTADPGVDFGAITFVVPDAVRRIGTPPFVSALAARVTDAARPNAERLAMAADAGRPPATDSGGSSGTAAQGAIPALLRPGSTAVVTRDAGDNRSTHLIAAEFGSPDVPSRRYIVHLQAPGWNVIGATAPWLPGVSIGHNERIAWAFTPSRVDTQDIYVEHFNPENPRQVRRGARWVDMDVDFERIGLKGRDEPFEYERQYTSNGVVIAIDKDRHLLYTLRWSGTEPGGAGELAALAVDRAQSFAEFQTALGRWKMPTAEFVYADVDGRTERAVAGLVPVRQEGTGAVPRAGWTGQGGWSGWTTPSARADVPVPGGMAVSTERLDPASASVRWLGDAGAAVDAVRVWNEPLPLQTRWLLGELAAAKDLRPEAEALRSRLVAWNGRVGLPEDETALFSSWLTSLRWDLTDGVVPTEFRQGLATDMNPAESIWSNAKSMEDSGSRKVHSVMGKALINAADSVSRGGSVTFAHPLAAFDTTRKRFNIGPIALPGASPLQLLSDGRLLTTLGLSLTPANWNQSVIRVGTGQSGSPASPHYDDMSVNWSNNRKVNLLFDQIDAMTAGAALLKLEPVQLAR